MPVQVVVLAVLGGAITLEVLPCATYDAIVGGICIPARVLGGILIALCLCVLRVVCRRCSRNGAGNRVHWTARMLPLSGR